MGSYTFLAVLRTVQEMPKRFKVYEKNSTLSAALRMASVQHIGETKRALEPAVASALTDEWGGEGPA